MTDGSLQEGSSSEQLKWRLPPHVLASYFSDARVNILACLNDVREKTGLSRVKDEAENVSALESISLTNAAPEDQEARMRLLRYRFPFLNPMTDPQMGKPAPQRRKVKNESLSENEQAKNEELAKNRALAAREIKPADFEKRLRWLLRLVHNLRNAFVHPTEEGTFISPEVHKNFFWDLGKVYDASLNIIESRFEVNSRVKESLLRKDSKGKPRLFQQFALALCIDPKENNGQTSIEAERLLHDFGLVLLCAMFLEKKQSAELISCFWASGYVDRCDWDQQAMVNEMIAVYRMRLPMQRLRPDESASVVVQHTLSELSRCPQVLFDALDQKDKNRFRIGMLPQRVEPKAEIESYPDASNTSHLLVRRGNRFIPLMMRLLDLNASSRLRFAVDLGQYFFNVRLKPAGHFTDRRPRVRRLGRKVIGYGRPRDFTDNHKPETWLRLEDNFLKSGELVQRAQERAGAAVLDLQPYIVPTEPHYHFFDDKIGLRLVNHDEVSTYPELPEVATKNSKSCVLNGIELKPDFWLSPVQMLHLGFYSFLQQRDSTCLPADVLLRRYRSGMQKLLIRLDQGLPELEGSPTSSERRAAAQRWVDDIFDVGGNQDGPEVHLGELPKVVVRALLGTGVVGMDGSKIDRRIKHLISDSEMRIKRLDAPLQGAKKRGKPGFKPLKLGPVAAFLTEDLLRFQPSMNIDPNGGKINSQHYRILEAALAYYEPSHIADLLRDAHLLDGSMRHLFLYRLGLLDAPEQFPNLMSFYRAYLHARIDFLQVERGRVANAQEPIQPQSWLRIRERSSLSRWLKNFKDVEGNLVKDACPLPISANLFYRPILVATARALDSTPEDLLERGSRKVECNDQTVTIRPALTWLLQHYLERQNDGPQAMYSYPRSHDLFDACLDTRTKKQKMHKRSNNALSELERREALTKIGQGKRGPDWKPLEDDTILHLREAYRRRERRVRQSSTQDMVLFLLGHAVFEKHVRLPAAVSRPVWRLRDIEHTLLNAEIDIELTVPNSDPRRILRHSSCKVRNVGELGLLARDRRLQSLLRYYPETETYFDQTEIRAEFDSYRRVRVEMMKLILKLELLIANVSSGTATGDLLEEEREIFGTGRHGKLLHQLRQLLRRTGIDELSSADDMLFRQALELRNAFAHNQYPPSDFFDGVASAIASEPALNASNGHRHIAKRLLQVMNDLYQPWFTFLTRHHSEISDEYP